MKTVRRHKNIAICISQLNYGGAEKQSILLAKVLMKFHHVQFIVLKGNRVEEKYCSMLEKGEIPYHALTGSFIWRLFHLYRMLQENKIEIVFCYLPLDNIIATIVGRIAGVKYVIGGIRNTKIVKKKFLIVKYIQNFLQDYIIFNSDRAKDIFCSHGYRKPKCLVIENSTDSRSDFQIRPNNSPVKILMVGRFVIQKDYLTGIRAVSYLYDSLDQNDLKLIIAGFGDMEGQIRKWITIHNLSEITEIHIRPDNLPILYRNCDIFFNSSIYEGFSNSIMEAMINGLPVVATDTGDTHKLVIHNKCGYISEVGDYKGLARNLKLLCENRKTRIDFGQAGHKNIYRNYNIEAFASKYLSLINTLE